MRQRDRGSRRPGSVMHTLFLFVARSLVILIGQADLA